MQSVSISWPLSNHGPLRISDPERKLLFCGYFWQYHVCVRKASVEKPLEKTEKEPQLMTRADRDYGY